MKYVVKNEGGVDINGNHYEVGHEFSWDEVPANVQPLVDSKDIKKK